MFEFLTRHLLLSTVVTILLGSLVRFLVKGYHVRRKFHSLHGPPHSWLWGHLRVMGEMVQEVPLCAHPHVVPGRIQKKYGLRQHFYMDLWPLADPILYVLSPDLSRAITQEHSFPKYKGLVPFMIHLAGPNDMVSANGEAWRKWRSIFNPGFASAHLMTLVPFIVDESVIFTQKLEAHARDGKVFRLEEDATRLTVDIIGKVALDVNLGTQMGENEMVKAFRDQVSLLPSEGIPNPLAMWLPMGVYRRWKNSRVMRSYVGSVLDERFARQAKVKDEREKGKKQRSKVIIDLALEAYRSQQASTGAAAAKGGTAMDEEFKAAATVHIRTFIFAGHDTTSSTIAYAFYMLSKSPECLQRIRQEHDDVLGDVASTPQTIKDDPYILNRLVFTLAVIRETLRLWPAASSVRDGDPRFVLRDSETGEALPTDDMLVWVTQYAQHRSEDIWGPTANSFDPSRFLPENAASLPEGAYRPFEKGSRSCIGQDLALIEIRVILALVVRRFDFRAAFDKLDQLKDDGSHYAKNERYRKGRQDLDGEEAYPILMGTAKPREGMPCTVTEVS